MTAFSKAGGGSSMGAMYVIKNTRTFIGVQCFNTQRRDVIPRIPTQPVR